MAFKAGRYIALCFIFSVFMVAYLNSAVADVVHEKSSGQNRTGTERYFELIHDVVLGRKPLDTLDDKGRPILITAVLYGTDEQLRGLISAGADPNSNYSEIPAVIFAVSDRCEVGKLTSLLSAGADLEARESLGGAKPLHYAAQHVDTSCLSSLLKNGANPNATDGRGRTAYFYAIDYGNKDAVDALWAAGGDPFIKSNERLDAFLWSIVMGNPDVVRGVLVDYIKKGAD